MATPDGAKSDHAAEYRECVDELVEMIAAAQLKDGYLNIYLTVVDPEGRFRNLRDLHEMCRFPSIIFVPISLPCAC